LSNYVNSLKFRGTLNPLSRCGTAYCCYYDGDLKYGEPHGIGKLYFHKIYDMGNPTSYEGELEFGMRNGKGIYQDDNVRIDGEWIND
jgi:hypothetical protein